MQPCDPKSHTVVDQRRHHRGSRVENRLGQRRRAKIVTWIEVRWPRRDPSQTTGRTKTRATGRSL